MLKNTLMIFTAPLQYLFDEWVKSYLSLIFCFKALTLHGITAQQIMQRVKLSKI